MKAAIILAMIIPALLAMNPSTRLPAHYDDGLWNNIPIGHIVSKEATHISSHPFFIFFSRQMISKFCEKNMSPEDFKRHASIIEKVATEAYDGESHNNYHSMFVTFDHEKATAFTYELNLIRKEKSVIAILSKLEQEIPRGTGVTTFGETYLSEFGLPYTQFSTLKTTVDMTEERREKFRADLVASAKLRRGSQLSLVKRTEGLGVTVAAACAAINAFCGAAQGLIKAFKTTKTETLKEMIKGEGFQKWAQKTRFIRALGVPMDKYDRFSNSYRILTGLSKTKYQNEVDAILDLGEFMDENVWGVNDFNFDAQTGGDVMNIVTVSRAEMSEMSVNFITAVVTGAFHLSPDVFIYTKHKSIAGGIFESTKDVRKKVPRNLSKDEVKAIQSMMLLSAIQVMAQAFDIDFKLPTDDPNNL